MTNTHLPSDKAKQAANRELESWATGAPPREGYYIPHRYAGNSVQPNPPQWLLRALDASVAPSIERLDRARTFSAELSPLAKVRDADPQGARFDQQWFTGLDATMAYTTVRHFQPRTIIEVGSGHSTRFMAKAISDGGLDTRLVSVDPQPRREIDSLCDRVVREPLNENILDEFAALEPGDILFLDGSHILMPGTDVELVFTHILPLLPGGVHLHIHDMFLPAPYPVEWTWRNYNEQPIVVALLGTGVVEIQAANAWLRRCHPQSLDGVFAPCTDGAFESSLWLKTRGGVEREL